MYKKFNEVNTGDSVYFVPANLEKSGKESIEEAKVVSVLDKEFRFEDGTGQTFTEESWNDTYSQGITLICTADKEFAEWILGNVRKLSKKIKEQSKK